MQVIDLNLRCFCREMVILEMEINYNIELNNLKYFKAIMRHIRVPQF
jgi:hypothetical protein